MAEQGLAFSTSFPVPRERTGHVPQLTNQSATSGASGIGPETANQDQGDTIKGLTEWLRRASDSSRSFWEGSVKPAPAVPGHILPPHREWSQPRGTELRNREARPSDPVVAPGSKYASSQHTPRLFLWPNKYPFMLRLLVFSHNRRDFINIENLNLMIIVIT